MNNEAIHVCRVRIELEFVGLIPASAAVADPAKAVEQKFRMFGPEISGFVLEKKQMSVAVKPATLPEIETTPSTNSPSA